MIKSGELKNLLNNAVGIAQCIYDNLIALALGEVK